MRVAYLASLLVISAVAPAQQWVGGPTYQDGVFATFVPRAGVARAEVERALGHRGKVVSVEKGRLRIEVRGGQVTPTLAARLRGLAQSLSPERPRQFPLMGQVGVKAMEAASRQFRIRDRAYEALRDPKKKEPEMEREGGYYDAYLHWYRQRAYPNDTIDTRPYDEAPAKIAQMKATPIEEILGSGPQLESTPQWQYVGPRNLDIPYRQYYGIPPLSGRINAIAIHPTNPNIIYLGTPNGGVWKTTNGGQSFQCITNNWPHLAVSGITIDPTNPNRIYVGTGDFQGMKMPYGIGIMKSVDGGATWTNTGFNEMNNMGIRKILVIPESPNIVIAISGRGGRGNGRIFTSVNYGATWSPRNSPQAWWSDLSMGARTLSGSRILYAAGGGNPGVVATSYDNGLTWYTLQTPLAQGGHYSVCIAASVLDPFYVYMMAPTQKKIWKSTDAGASWTDITDGFPAGDQDYNWSQGFYDFYLETTYDTSTGFYDDAIIVGLIDVVHSRDGGMSWQSLGGPVYDANRSILHSDQHSIGFFSNNEFLIGCDGGLFRMSYNEMTGQVTNRSLNQDIGITQFYAAAFHPTNPNIMIGGTQDNASPYAGGDLMNWKNPGAGDGGGCYISPSNPNFQINTSQFFSIFRTLDGWRTPSQYIKPNIGQDVPPFVCAVEGDPNNPNRVYFGTNFLWRLNNDLNNWTPRLGNQMMSQRGQVTAIAVALGDSNVIYTGTSEGAIFMTRNGGTTWTRIETGTPALPNKQVSAIEIHPMNKNDIVVSVQGTGGGKVWRLTNTLATTRVWVDRSGTAPNRLVEVPVNSLCRSPYAPDTHWYVGSDFGVFATSDGGATWTNMTQPFGMPVVQVNKVELVPGTSYLMAATFARGMYRMPIARPPQRLTSFTITPSTVRGGSSVAGIVTLAYPAIPNTRVMLQTNSTSILVPTSFPVAAGATTARFTIRTSAVPANTSGVVTARIGTSAISKRLYLNR